jgi:hypothetical protein
MFKHHRRLVAGLEKSTNDSRIPQLHAARIPGRIPPCRGSRRRRPDLRPADSKYSVSGEYNKCLLHLWSAERNAVRRILDAEVRNGSLRLMVQKLGHARPSKLEICRGQDHRTPTARRVARSTYQQQLRRALERHFPGFTTTKLSNAMDLERSFGPIYTRGILRQGRTAFAVLGVNQQETQASIDAALTFAILWLDICRNSEDQRVLVEGVKLFLPAGT